eukprot:2742407-Alexandrium_andersonii.AAC.1
MPWPGGAAMGWCRVPGAFSDEQYQWQQWQQWEWEGGGKDRGNGWDHGDMNGEMFAGNEISDAFQDRLLRELRPDGPPAYWKPC